jgi:hypothetical protein
MNAVIYPDREDPQNPRRDKNRGIATQKPVMEFGRSFKYLLIIY